MHPTLRFAVILLLTGPFGAPSVADQWVDDLFKVRSHDFLTVARGSDTSFKFEAKNIYKQPVRLVSVRSSCGCTSPRIEKPGTVLKTGETGYVIATFNTRTFTGVHGATLTVRAEWTDEKGAVRSGETSLRVDGNIRADVQVQPGAVRFDSIDQGKPFEQMLQITRSGSSNWRIDGVDSSSPAVAWQLKERQRSYGRVIYDLTVRVKEDAPAGILQERVILRTNDRHSPQVAIVVEGKVRPALSVMPATLSLGSVKAGEEKMRRVIVRGGEPFRIRKVSCDDDCFRFEVPDKKSDRHIVEVYFRPQGAAGRVKKNIEFHTDLGEGATATAIAYASVAASEPNDERLQQEATGLESSGTNESVGSGLNQGSQLRRSPASPLQASTTPPLGARAESSIFPWRNGERPPQVGSAASP